LPTLWIGRPTDDFHRDNALEDYFYDAIDHEAKSLVDEVIKMMLVDKNLKVDYLISFDERLNNFALSQGVQTKP